MIVRAAIVLAVSALCAQAEYTDPHCSGKQVIVHLFEWKWTDIADECERFLSKKGYCGVQISPANENAVIDPRPWWERYQPVSYKISTRSGSEAEFKDMVTRCKNVGVRIYVDVVVNHMAGLGRIGTGTGGTHFDSDNFDFPGVPYTREHFNPRSKCPSGDGNVNNYGDPNNVRNCFLVGLTDLNQNLEYVRDKISGYFNKLIAMGVAGFRVDAAKHMWPADIKAIQERTSDLPEGGKPFFYHEVIDQNDGAIKVTEYEPYGYVTEMRYCQKIAWGINNFGQLNNVVDYGWGMTDSAHAFIFVDNHDNQRGHGGGGNLITHKQPRTYKLAQAFTLAYNYGFPRVMSSYYFQSTDQGPPHNGDFSTKDVTIDGDGLCGNGWVCEHRWPAIANMVRFRNAVAGTDLNHWRNENDEVSFSRGQKGFFAMAKQGHMDATLQTGLPAGQYCDLVTDCRTKVTVDGNGNAHIVITDNENPILAFIVGGPDGPTETHGSSGGSSGTGTGSEVTSGPAVTSAPVTQGPAPTGWARTIIMVQAQTSTGQDVFIRGGIDHGHRQGCSNQASSNPCAIPIKSHELGTGDHYAGYNAWRQGDNFLDWYGAEPGQGSFHGVPAKGTPAVWTTNQPGGHGYTPLNTYGQHYWLIDVDMDCSKTENGWFEVKAMINNNWEHDMRISGCGMESAPYASNNHWAKCGSKNVLHFNSGSCEISSIE
ncbi:alpha-amylase-like [Argopecten irradians]|uniref:alpha-amylase-like n=1 Tax=Argopecten irradians TaxID=31199 RepID=UPI00371E6BE9